MGLFSRNRGSRTAGILGVEAGPQGIALDDVRQPPGQAPQLLWCDFLHGAEAAQPELLKGAVSRHGLAGASVNLVLHPSDYQLFLLESADVPADELRDAMRWRIKDVISDSLDDVVVDCFALPDDAYRGRTRMVYCVVLRKARMNDFALLVEQAGLKLASIDITAMAFR